jgi:uncharacterized hydrophobic protein (TIGR00341 family)
VGGKNVRQLLIQVPRGQGEPVLRIAQKQKGANLARWEVMSADGPAEMVVVHVSNRRVEDLVAELQALPDLRLTLIPRGVMVLHPPPDEAPQQVTDIESRSPFEIFLSGLQSVGSWRGFLSYAAAAGVVVWIGLVTNTIYLLVAAMLIAPFAGPAMQVAMGTARGDTGLIRRGLLRYVASLAVTITLGAALTLLFQQEIATEQMVQTSEISSVAVLLPLAAGAAGALNLVQSDRNSLVSGAAVGMLVAASLAPPAGLIGMAAAIGRWEMAQSGLFLLALQLLAINLSGATVFRLYGLSAQGARYSRGRPRVFPLAVLVTLIGLGGVLWWQFRAVPNLQRSTLAERAAAEVQQVVNESGIVHLVEANVRFTRARIEGQNTLLGVLYVQRREDVTLSDETIRRRLIRAIQEHLNQQFRNITPVVSVNLLEPPPAEG